MAETSAMNILVVEDENIVAVDIQDRLVRLGYSIVGHVTTGEDAISMAEKLKPDLILMDIMLKGGMDGVEAAERIRKSTDIPVIFLTAYTDTSTLQRAKLTEPFGYILKPFEERELHSTIEMAFYRHNLEKRLRESRQWLNTVLNSIAEAVIASDEQGRVTFMNPRAEELIWKSFQECKGKSIWDVLSLRRADTGEPVNKREMDPHALMDCILKTVGDRELDVGYSASQIMDEQGIVKGMVVVLRDITSRKRYEEELERAMKAAETASNSKSEFLANMSHEIRTPMNGILGMTELMMETKLIGDQKEYMLIIRESANSLLKLLNDILDFSKVEAGHVDFEIIDFELEPILDAVLENVYHLSPGLGVEFIPFVHRDVPSWLQGDPARLRQILTNLVGNAAKFTHEGHVLVEVEKLREGADGIELKFSVSDTGVGIPEGKLETIFESFTQADGSTTRQYGGTGLGLAISRKLVAMMDGRISVESVEGKGSSFHFTLTFGRSAIMQDPPPPALKGKRAFVFALNDYLRQSLSEMLYSLGIEAIMAGDMEEALAVLDKAGRNIDICIMDFDSSRNGNISDLKDIRTSLSGARGILLSSAAFSEGSSILSDLSVHSYIRKPLKITGVRKKLINLFDSPDSGAGAESGHMDLGRRLRILLVEDNPVNQRVAEKVLESVGHEVVTAMDGREAVKIFKSGERFDLILMDLQMPDMDGFEATTRIRQSTEKGLDSDIPIVALTAHAMLGDMDNCLRVGMNGFVAKPFRREDLLREIENAMADHDWKFGSGDHRETVPEKGELLDTELALDRLDGDRELYDEICQYFLDTIAGQLSRIEESFEKSDIETLRREAHSLKSSSGSVGAMRLHESSRNVEMISSNDATGSLDSAMDELRQDITEAIGALQAIVKKT